MAWNGSFRGLQNYTTLKRVAVSTMVIGGFRGLQNYTTLKRDERYINLLLGFRGLQNYTTLKLIVSPITPTSQF